MCMWRARQLALVRAPARMCLWTAKISARDVSAGCCCGSCNSRSACNSQNQCMGASCQSTLNYHKLQSDTTAQSTPPLATNAPAHSEKVYCEMCYMILKPERKRGVAQQLRNTRELQSMGTHLFKVLMDGSDHLIPWLARKDVSQGKVAAVLG